MAVSKKDLKRGFISFWGQLGLRRRRFKVPKTTDRRRKSSAEIVSVRKKIGAKYSRFSLKGRNSQSSISETEFKFELRKDRTLKRFFCFTLENVIGYHEKYY